MRDAHFTRQERFVIAWLKLLCAGFLLVGILFAAYPNYLLEYLDEIGSVFFNYPSQTLQAPHLDIWWILSLAFMASLAYACFLAQANWMRHNNLIPLVILAKAITAIGFGLQAYFYPTHFFYIVAGGIDGLLFLITAFAYVKAINSRTYLQASPH